MPFFRPSRKRRSNAEDVPDRARHGRRVLRDRGRHRPRDRSARTINLKVGDQIVQASNNFHC
jgi:hypothetical protein